MYACKQINMMLPEDEEVHILTRNIIHLTATIFLTLKLIELCLDSHIALFAYKYTFPSTKVTRLIMVISNSSFRNTRVLSPHQSFASKLPYPTCTASIECLNFFRTLASLIKPLDLDLLSCPIPTKFSIVYEQSGLKKWWKPTISAGVLVFSYALLGSF